MTPTGPVTVIVVSRAEIFKLAKLTPICAELLDGL